MPVSGLHLEGPLYGMLLMLAFQDGTIGFKYFNSEPNGRQMLPPKLEVLKSSQ